jgi:hypothetical protein
MNGPNVLENRMNQPKYELFKEYVDDFKYFELKALFIKGKIGLLMHSITSDSTEGVVDATNRKIKQLESELEDARKFL